MITITISGFKTKQEAIYWLKQYEGGIEQHFDKDAPKENCFPVMTVIEDYIAEMNLFTEFEEMTNFDLKLK